MICNICKSEIVDQSRLCNICGHPTSVNPTIEDLNFLQLSANAPEALVQKVRSLPYLAKEKRNVSALMLVVSNNEQLKQHIPDEESNKLINETLNRVASRIYEFEGTIAKLWENTILAFFGAPLAHEDDPLRAVHAADAILKEVNSINNYGSHSSAGVPLHLKVVLNTGPVLIGELKTNLRFEFQSLNSTLECLDRAAKLAIPDDKIILFEDTYRFIQRNIECSPIEGIYCEETKNNLPLWQIDLINKPSDHIQKLPMIRSAALVGRQKELDQLLELSETVMAGLGRIGLIIGEPGIGKSRLIFNWKHQLKTMQESTPIRWIQAHGLAFGQELAFHLLKELLRETLNISGNTPEFKITEIIKNTINKFPDNDKESLVIFLAHLLELPLPDQDEELIHSLSAFDLRTKYLHAISTLFINLSREQPLLIILEDVHWADASSVELLIELLSLTITSPILFCLATRKDRESNGWELITAARNKFGSRLTRIELENLNEHESEMLVKNLIELDEVPETIRRMVLTKSEGNPHFIEELIRMLINEEILTKRDDQWVVTKNIDPNKIPDNLQSLFVARIDRLPPEARLTIRIASVIGRSFTEKVIESVMSNHAPEINLMEQLSELEALGMIKVIAVKPELTYKFQHFLMQDAAYHSIIDADLVELHQSVGNTLESYYPDQKERLASQLAHHFHIANNKEKAYFYLDLAGHVAMNSFAATEAQVFYSQAVQHTEDSTQLAHLYTDLGETYAQQGDHRQAIQTWKKAIHHLHQTSDADQLARVYAWSARSAWRGYDPKRSLEICLDGLEDIKGADESPNIAYLIHETGRSFLFNDQPDQAKVYAEQALEMAKWLDAFDVQAETLATIGILPSTKPEQAIAALELAVQISEAHNLNKPGSRAYINLAAVIDHLGEIRLAKDYRIRAVRLGNKAGGVTNKLLLNQAIVEASLWLAEFNDAESRIKRMKLDSYQTGSYLHENTLTQLYLKGRLFHFRGMLTQAIETFNDLIDRGKQINDLDQVLHANLALANVLLEPHLVEDKQEARTDVNIAQSLLLDMFKNKNEGPEETNVPILCLLTDIYTLKGNLQKAEGTLNQANDIYKAQPSMQDRFRILLSQARCEAARNNHNRALDIFNQAIEIADTMEGRWWKAHIWLEMGNLHLKQNEPEDIDKAHNFYRESLAEFNSIKVNYFPDIILDKLRYVKHVSRSQAIAHHKLNQELAEAGRIQHTFLPTNAPVIKGYDISCILLSAHETSGDFYDFIDLEDDKVGFVIADVGDKGAGAALYMAMSRTLIRTYASEGSLEPREVLNAVNRRILADTRQGIYLTLFYGILDSKDNTFTYINAGHNPPYHIKPDGQSLSLTRLEKTGALVGIFSEQTWDVKTIQLSINDVLVLYTDGITEAQNEQGEFYGEDKLINALENDFNTNSEIYRNNLLEDVHEFTGNAQRLDDITMIVISCTEDPQKKT